MFDLDHFDGLSCLVYGPTEPGLTCKDIVHAEDGSFAQGVESLREKEAIVDHDVDDALHDNEDAVALVANLEKDLLVVVEFVLCHIVKLS